MDLKIRKEVLENKLSDYKLTELAQYTNFEMRSPNKISAEAYVLSFFEIVANGAAYSPKQWAEYISLLTENIVSSQAVEKKLQYRHLLFSEVLLEEALLRNPSLESTLSKSVANCSNIFSIFSGVYLEDSTCFKLPVCLADMFPGSHSKKGKAATVRIQLCFNLLSNTYKEVSIQSYRDNDQSYAYHTVNQLSNGNLLIRDMGYFCIGAFKKVKERNAHFLSRYKKGVNVYDVENKCKHKDTEGKVDLAKQLKCFRKRGKTVVDIPVLLGSKEKLAVRMVAVLADEQIVAERKRKAKKNRDKRLKNSEDEYLHWTIFITSVDSSVWSFKDILIVYGLRWRIEIVFKCWKSNFKLHQLFQYRSTSNPFEVLIVIRLFLVFLTLFYLQYYNYFVVKIYDTYKKIVSIFKFAQYLKKNFTEIINEPDLDFHLRMIDKFYCHRRQKGQKLQMEIIYMTI